MKKILMMTMIAITSAVIAGAKAECTVEVNHKNAIYKCGEKAEFTISITGKDGNLATNGFADNTCSPSAVYAGYNVVPSKDKKIYHGIGMGHAVRASLSGPLYKWQMEK
jgi:hypothetical protein